MRSVSRVLIANRGEIAVRVIRACRDEGIESVAVYSDADRKARHVRLADFAVRLGPAPSSESYLLVDKVLAAAKASGADAIHPGYGFLSENAAFARAVEEAGLAWIGPPPAAIEVMGDKGTARAAAVKAGVPIVPGTEPVSDEQAVAAAADIGFPILIKAVAGGGGKGMRRVDKPADLASALQLARSEARNAFGNDSVYIEKFLSRPRHVEIQVFSGADGRSIHLGERDCSTQRRHQKLIEESPSPVVSPALRARMGAVACAVADAVSYQGAGTVEFLVDPEDRGADGEFKFYFLEMNTRLQVEHPVTELVTGLDLVRLQFAVARGEALPLSQDEVRLAGHALECRLYAEDAAAGFVPSPGTLSAFLPPDGPGVRCDSGVEAGDEISIHYDPMIAKLLTWGRDRSEAIARMKRALAEFEVSGVKTSAAFHLHLLALPAFVDGEVHVNHVDREFDGERDLAATVPDEELGLQASVVALEELLRGRRRALRPAEALSPWAEAGRLAIKGRR